MDDRQFFLAVDLSSMLCHKKVILSQYNNLLGRNPLPDEIDYHKKNTLTDDNKQNFLKHCFCNNFYYTSFKKWFSII